MRGKGGLYFFRSKERNPWQPVTALTTSQILTKQFLLSFTCAYYCSSCTPHPPSGFWGWVSYCFYPHAPVLFNSARWRADWCANTSAVSILAGWQGNMPALNENQSQFNLLAPAPLGRQCSGAQRELCSGRRVREPHTQPWRREQHQEH